MKSPLKQSVEPDSSVDLLKPVVKEFVDEDQKVITFLQTRLVHVPYTIPKINCVKVSKDKTEKSFRINWYSQDNSGLTRTNKIVSSQYVKVVIKDDQYEIVN